MTAKILTKGELEDLSLRIDEIDLLLDQNLPENITFNLEQELDYICRVLEDGIRK